MNTDLGVKGVNDFINKQDSAFNQGLYSPNKLYSPA